MPYSVGGWIESNHETLAERGATSPCWEALLCLGPFGLRGDAISSRLFGLAREPYARAPFRERGVPADCSSVVRAEIEANERFIATHGEGDFGHTYASWGEITRALADANAPTPEDEGQGGWRAVLESVAFLSSRFCFAREPHNQLRVIVWASW